MTNLVAIACLLFIGQSNMVGRPTGSNALGELASPQDDILSYIPAEAGSSATWRTLRPYAATQWGSEIKASRLIKDNGGEYCVVKIARGGCSLAVDWAKGNSTGKGMYAIMLEGWAEAKLELERDYQKTPKVVAIFWSQGLTDAKDTNRWMMDQYEENLKRHISNVRSDLNCPGAWCIISRASTYTRAETYIYRAELQRIQAKVARDTIRCLSFNADSCALKSDELHYSQSGLIQLGTLFANAYKGRPRGTVIKVF